MSKEVSKALRFGLEDKHPNQYTTNKENIEIELNDLFAVVSMLMNDGIIDYENLFIPKAINDKKSKVEKYLKIFKSLGR